MKFIHLTNVLSKEKAKKLNDFKEKYYNIYIQKKIIKTK